VIIDEIEFTKSLGQRIKKMRLEKNLSQFDLSIECGIPKNQNGRIERGLNFSNSKNNNKNIKWAENSPKRTIRYLKCIFLI